MATVVPPTVDGGEAGRGGGGGRGGARPSPRSSPRARRTRARPRRQGQGARPRSKGKEQGEGEEVAVRARWCSGSAIPGARYARTRHNVGVAGAGAAGRALGRRGRPRRAATYRAWQRRASAGAAVDLLQPLTYMNLSGEALRGVARSGTGSSRRSCWWWRTTSTCRSGTLRLRPRGSSGGHRGLESIEEALGQPRLRAAADRRRRGGGRRGAAGARAGGVRRGGGDRRWTRRSRARRTRWSAGWPRARSPP